MVRLPQPAGYMGCFTGLKVLDVPKDVIPVNRPQRVRDSRGYMVDSLELKYDRRTLEQALEVMAEYIHLANEDLTIIIVGGAVNTILLENRQATHDIDFLGTNINRDQHRTLMGAAAYARSRCQPKLEDGWWNNEVNLGLPTKLLQKITEEAIEQDEVVFQRRALKVIAAPWELQLCGKINRHACGDTVRPYDISDAVAYLRRYIERHDGHPVSAKTIRRWAISYYKRTNLTIIGQIAKEYKRIYGRDGIVECSSLSTQIASRLLN
jgi:hypothetical protein